MNGWHTIKEVRKNITEAAYWARRNKKTYAREYMKRARRLLVQYCKDERYPEHGFETEEIGS